MVGDVRIVPRSLRCSISVGWVPRSLLRKTYSQTSKSPIGVGTARAVPDPYQLRDKFLCKFDTLQLAVR